MGEAVSKGVGGIAWMAEELRMEGGGDGVDMERGLGLATEENCEVGLVGLVTTESVVDASVLGEWLGVGVEEANKLSVIGLDIDEDGVKLDAMSTELLENVVEGVIVTMRVDKVRVEGREVDGVSI